MTAASDKPLGMTMAFAAHLLVDNDALMQSPGKYTKMRRQSWAPGEYLRIEHGGVLRIMIGGQGCGYSFCVADLLTCDWEVLP